MTRATQASISAVLFLVLGFVGSPCAAQTCMQSGNIGACVAQECAAEASTAFPGPECCADAALGACLGGYHICDINVIYVPCIQGLPPTPPPPPPLPPAPPHGPCAIEENLCITFVDPVPFPPPLPTIGLLNGNSLTSNPTLLAFNGTVVQAIAADGAARVVIRIAADAVNEQIQLTLVDENNSPGQPGSIGWLSSINGSEQAETLQVTAQSAPQGIPMAFAVYYPPPDFSRGSADDNAPTRQVTVQVKSLTYQAAANSGRLTLLRPPVVLVHGLWANKTDWRYFVPFLTDQRFQVFLANYGQPIDLVSFLPLYTGYTNLGSLPKPKRSALGFAFNAQPVLDDIKNSRDSFRRATNPAHQQAAAAQVDVVAHSMGGLVTRTLEKLPSFNGTDSFGVGIVHKLITIGTSHFGSPLAAALLPNANQDANSCVRNVFDWNGLYVISSANAGYDNLPGGEWPTGGVWDQQGDGKGAQSGDNLSAALQNLQSANTVPTAVIGGKYNNWASLNPTWIQLPLHLNPVPTNTPAQLLTMCSAAPLALNLASQGWRQVMGGDNDGIVPLTSALAGNTSSSTNTPSIGVAHSLGTETLGFTAPDELDPDTATGIQTMVIRLLNEQTQNMDFKALQPQ